MVDALLHIAAPWPMFLCLLGVFLGIIVGAIPGFSGTMLITLTVPLTFTMLDLNAMVLMISMYVGSISGGLISATLLRMPGTPGAIMTVLDGYPMAQRGEAARALALGVTGSFVGGLVSWIFLYTLSPTLAIWGAKFGPWEIFTMTAMALALIASLTQGTLLKGLLAAMLGIMVSLPGMDPSSGMLRMTFGITSLSSGFGLVPVLLGIFVISQVLQDISKVGKKPELVEARGSLFLEAAVWVRQSFNMLRSSLIGTWVGILPGVGASVGAIVSYTVAKNASKTPEKFGTGFEDGIVAAETANNATIGGALIPLVTLGIPGSTVDAILIGALLLHNLQPGPMLFVTNPTLIYVIIASCLLANVVMFFMMTGMCRKIAHLAMIPVHLLLPPIVLCCLLGSLAIFNSIFDVWVAIGFGVLGYVMSLCKLPHGPFIIGFILASLAEASLRTALMASGGSWSAVLDRPVALLFLFVTASMLFFSLRRELKAKKRVFDV